MREIDAQTEKITELPPHGNTSPTTYISFCAKSVSISQVDFLADIAASKKYFRQKFKVELKFICAEFQFFSTYSEYDIITILVNISHGNGSLASYTTEAWKKVSQYSTLYR